MKNLLKLFVFVMAFGSLAMEHDQHELADDTTNISGDENDSIKQQPEKDNKKSIRIKKIKREVLYNTLKPRKVATFSRQEVKNVHLSPNGNELLLILHNKTLARMTSKGQPIATLIDRKRLFFKKTIISANYSRDGKQIAAILSNGDINIWTTESNEPRLSFYGDKKPLKIVFNHDGSEIAASFQTGKIKIWLSNNGELKRELDHADKQAYRSLHYSDDGSMLLSSSTNTVTVWYKDDSYLDIPTESNTTRSEATWYPVGKVIVIDHGSRLKKWDLETNRMIRDIPHTYVKNSVGFRVSKSGKKILTAYDDGLIEITNEGEEKSLFTRIPDFKPSKAMISQDEKQLITQSEEGFTLWNMPKMQLAILTSDLDDDKKTYLDRLFLLLKQKNISEVPLDEFKRCLPRKMDEKRVFLDFDDEAQEILKAIFK